MRQNSQKKPVYDWKARRTASHLLPLKARTNGLCYPCVASVRYLWFSTQINRERIDPCMRGAVRLDGRQRALRPSIIHRSSTDCRGLADVASSYRNSSATGARSILQSARLLPTSLPVIDQNSLI